MINHRLACVSRATSMVLVALATLVSANAEAQQFKATVAGTLTDAQGAVVPGVNVAVLNVDTNVATDLVTNAQGIFVAQDLIPGTYRITASLVGFKTYVREGIVLRTAETVTLHIPLTLGAQDSKPQWSMSVFKNTRMGVDERFRCASKYSMCSTYECTVRRTPRRRTRTSAPFRTAKSISRGRDNWVCA
jgi:hypothetical protein